MTRKKTVGWTALVFLFVLMFIIAVIFLIASSPPSGYRPYQLTQKERKEAAKHFIDHHGFVFLNKIMENQPFTHTLTESDLNMYLASLDEIAFLKPAKRGEQSDSGEVFRAMDKAGLADPAVKLSDGVVTLMVQTKKARKVISFDLAFEFDDDRMRVSLKQVRIGRMPVPEFILRGSIDALKKGVKNRPQMEEIRPEDFDAMLAGLIAAMGEDAVPTTLRFSRKRLRKIRDVDVVDGQLNIYIVPVTRETPED